MADTRREGLKFASRAVHAGERPAAPDFVPVTTPIYPASSFTYEDPTRLEAALAGDVDSYAYSRYGNPTVNAMETAVAVLEEQEAALGFGSGMAAVNAVLLAAVRQGDHVVASRDVYGQTTALLNNLYTGLGVEVDFVDILDLEALEAALRPGKTKAVLCEAISNPLLRVTDVAAVAERAHSIGAALIVDNTFPTPYLFTPGTHGADYVAHSSTKYLGGHGDVTAGIVATTAERRFDLNTVNKTIGSITSPFDSWLVLRGIKTLPLRMQRQCENAVVVANWLREHPKLSRVNFPGFPDHESHEVARRQFKHGLFGAMVSFEIRDGTVEQVFNFMRALEMVVPATTLGDVYSLVLHPATSSHRALTPEQREAWGIRDGLVRLSVGIEDPEDIIADLERGLAQV